MRRLSFLRLLPACSLSPALWPGLSTALRMHAQASHRDLAVSTVTSWWTFACGFCMPAFGLPCASSVLFTHGSPRGLSARSLMLLHTAVVSHRIAIFGQYLWDFGWTVFLAPGFATGVGSCRFCGGPSGPLQASGPPAPTRAAVSDCSPSFLTCGAFVVRLLASVLRRGLLSELPGVLAPCCTVCSGGQGLRRLPFFTII